MQHKLSKYSNQLLLDIREISALSEGFGWDKKFFGRLQTDSRTLQLVVTDHFIEKSEAARKGLAEGLCQDIIGHLIFGEELGYIKPAANQRILNSIKIILRVLNKKEKQEAA